MRPFQPFQRFHSFHRLQRSQRFPRHRRWPRPVSSAALAISLAAIACAGGNAGAPSDQDLAECFGELAAALSADDMGGRGIGSPGLDKAARLLEERFAAIGLATPGDSERYRQPFSVETGVALGRNNRLASSVDRELRLREDWMPLGFAESGAFDAELVFAGYGIRAPDLGYDDYAGVDAAGKVILAMRYEPQEDDDESPFAGRRPTHHSGLRAKALNARELRAAALVLVSPAEQQDDPDKLPILRSDGPVSDAGLPVLQVSREVANRWLASTGTDLEALRAAIDADLEPRSRATGVRVRGRIDLERTKAEARNIVGILPGTGDLANEVVVVGAHYDHLGRGGAGSRTPRRREIHNGADDNASGVAAMVCGVEALRRETPVGAQRTLVVIAFTAEEIGLGGSAWYLHHPVETLDDTVAMVNLDMVGRVRDSKLFALGSDSAPEWQALLESAARESELRIGLGGDGYGPSDHSGFYSRGIPVVHLFSGSHEEYHTPEDDFPTLNVEGGAKVARFLAGTLRGLRSAEAQPSYVASTEGSPFAGDARGYGAYLGTIPDYTTLESGNQGVLLAGVRAGGPAQQAGLRAGDRIVEMGGIAVRNLYDMTFVLRDHRPGDTIEITVARGKQRKSFPATLSKRPVDDSPLGSHGSPTHGPAEHHGPVEGGEAGARSKK